ncbi:Chromosome condensation complex protein [Mycena venus]|uniref:Chromosome condensation complex protein n=1 Tax=Mycena venus TaxID=2733690 RepID=A0A8H6WXJ2_9AGAR|nr:Chromosome condensation complex protein [Mycena venus]
MPARTLAPVDLTSAVSHIYDQVQSSTANHQKNYVALHKLHLEAARTKQISGEREFEAIFQALLARALPIKKGQAAADRVIKFVGGYTKFLNERAADERAEQEDEGDDDATDTTASRFTERLLLFLLKGFQAKDKFVRYRVISLAGEMVISLGELDVEIYDALRNALLDRIHDKEAMVRLQVVIALSKLAASEDPLEVAKGEQSLLEALMDTLSSDPSAEVRRAALVNIPVNPTSLPALLARARDTEETVRKLLYNSALERASSDAAHPRILTIAQRELLVRHGLGDRQKSVRAAAADLLGTWIDVIGEKAKPEEELASRVSDIDISKTEEKLPLSAEEKQQKTIKTLTTFLDMFDLQVSSEGAQLAADALISVFGIRPEILEDLYFGDTYFADLTPEKAFLARVFVDHCKEDKGQGDLRMEGGGIPVVTNCAFRVQAGYNALGEIVGQDEDKIFERQDKEFILSELLKLAVNLDYTDEIGRRKMFALVRDMLTSPTLPLDVVPRCLDVLRQLSSDERDLIRVVVEIITDLREPGDEDDLDAADQTQDTINPDDAVDASFASEQSAAPKKPGKDREEMSPEEQARIDMIDMRCLILCIGMLERVNGTVDENSTLQGILPDLIIPSVQRKDQEFREKGLIALGLFCLIAKNLALKTLPLFISQAEADVPEALKITLLQIIFDLLMVHERTLLAPGGENAEKILSFLVTQLGNETDKDDTSPKVLALLGTGIPKLLLCGMIADETVVKSLLMVYFSPYNADNQELKQCLTFFAPMYSCSTAKNQQTMRKIFVYIFQKLSKLRQHLEGEEDVLSLTSVANMWIDWTDPSRVHDPNGPPGAASKAGDPLIQFDMANDILRALLTDKMPKEDKRILCQILPKLYIPDEVDVDKIRTLKLLIENVSTRRPLGDTTANNALKKFDAAIQKKFEKELEGFSEAEYRELQKLQELFDFLDDIIPEDDDEVIDTEIKKKGRKRRSGSIASTTTDADDVSVASSRRGKSKPQKKRRRLSTSDDEESDSDDNNTAKGTPPPPTRTLPKRSAAKKEVIVISSDDDDDSEEEDVETTPAPRKSRPRVSARSRKEEAMVDADIDDLLDDGGTSVEIPHDSIMDDSDEEEEVNDLLVED